MGGAVYLSEYARDNWATRTIRLAMINLAGIPSVVYGLFGLGMFVLFLRFGTSIIAGALTLAIMTLPIIISTAEEALRAVPVEFRTVSASVGGTRWQGIRYVVLPQALPGIITGVILGLLRAAGETAPILFTVAAFYLPRLPRSAVRPNDGAAVSSLRHQHPGARDAVADSVWHGSRLADPGALAQPDGDGHPQLLPPPAPVVMPDMPDHTPLPPKIRIEQVSYFYGAKQALNEVTLDIPQHAVTVCFGPAGCGKTTLLRLINRLNDLVDGTRRTGQIFLDDRDIYAPGTDVPWLRRRVGMVFALPLPLPGTIRENIIYGLKLAGERNRARLEEAVVRSLTQAALWDEVKDRLDTPAMAMSGGQQQRLCIARSLALEPEVLLLDAPTSGLDPISTDKVEESLLTLKQTYTIVVVPHSIQQAARIADHAAFLLDGALIEYRPGSELFTQAERCAHAGLCDWPVWIRWTRSPLRN